LRSFGKGLKKTGVKVSQLRGKGLSDKNAVYNAERGKKWEPPTNRDLQSEVFNELRPKEGRNPSLHRNDEKKVMDLSLAGGREAKKLEIHIVGRKLEAGQEKSSTHGRK